MSGIFYFKVCFPCVTRCADRSATSSTISPRLVTPPSTTSQLLRFYPKTPQHRGKPTGFLSLLAASPRDLNGYLFLTQLVQIQ